MATRMRCCRIPNKSFQKKYMERDISWTSIGYQNNSDLWCSKHHMRLKHSQQYTFHQRTSCPIFATKEQYWKPGMATERRSLVRSVRQVSDVFWSERNSGFSLSHSPFLLFLSLFLGFQTLNARCWLVDWLVGFIVPETPQLDGLLWFVRPCNNMGNAIQELDNSLLSSPLMSSCKWN